MVHLRLAQDIYYVNMMEDVEENINFGNLIPVYDVYSDYIPTDFFPPFALSPQAYYFQTHVKHRKNINLAHLIHISITLFY